MIGIGFDFEDFSYLIHQIMLFCDSHSQTNMFKVCKSTWSTHHTVNILSRPIQQWHCPTIETGHTTATICTRAVDRISYKLKEIKPLHVNNVNMLYNTSEWKLWRRYPSPGNIIVSEVVEPHRECLWRKQAHFVLLDRDLPIWEPRSDSPCSPS